MARWSRKRPGIITTAPDTVGLPFASRSELDDNIGRRVFIFLVIVAVVLVVLLIRMWTMQVVMGAEYRDRSEGNRLREIPLVANRGLIYDRNGHILVDNKGTMMVSVSHDAPTSAANLKKWSKTLRVSKKKILERVRHSKAQNPIGRRFIAEDVSMDVVAKIREHRDDYPEMLVSLESHRVYPSGKVAAHTLGYVGQISDKQLQLPKYEGYEPTDVLGKAGVELSYESLLAGVKGMDYLEVNAVGTPVRRVKRIPPVPGHSIKLTIDRRIQRSAEESLKYATKLARKAGMKNAKQGAVVVLDPKNGDLLALASFPTYDPKVFVGGVTQKQWKALNAKKSGLPLFNRSLMSAYPPGSTLKPFVALAAIKTGQAKPTTILDCPNKWRPNPKWPYKKDWYPMPGGRGRIGFRTALKYSCNTFFYQIGYNFYRRGGLALQDYMGASGFGRATGIDLPFEVSGRVPTPAWKKAFNKHHPEYAPWLPGDTINMSVGQGDFLSSPLQVAVAYGALANGGILYRPHVVDSVMASDGRLIAQVKPEPIGSIPEAKKNSVIQAGLRDVVSDGTAEKAFRGFAVEVAGKTGTSQVLRKDDYAWFAGYAPAKKPRYVVVIMVEEGGHGGSVAAPAARRIFADLFGIKEAAIAAPIQDDSR